MAWVWRRLLTIVGFAHANHVVHGAVLPPHVVIEPKEHKLLLKMREIWMEAVPRVPRMGATTSPDDDLVAVLGMEASTREAWVRAALGPELQNQLFEHPDCKEGVRAGCCSTSSSNR